MFDQMQIEILADGTLKTTTDPISQANHHNAESFVRGIAELAGGNTTREKRKDKGHDQHHHHGEHVHQGGKK